MKNKTFSTIVIGAGLFVISNVASAIPTLQLDILGGTYCDDTCAEPLNESVITSDTSFSLFAYANPDGKSTGPNAITEEDVMGETNVQFYLSVALTPTTADGTGLGSFEINGITYDTSSLAYGNPPLDASLADLPNHSIYDTLYAEIMVEFDPANLSCDYNVQDNPGIGPQDPSGGCGSGTTMYFSQFDVDMSGLAAGIDLHFDLYAVDSLLTNGQQSLVDFAPFSHDAQTNRVPAPGAAFLMGLGLLGLAAVRRKIS